jgi:hypothetical protein
VKQKRASLTDETIERQQTPLEEPTITKNSS